MRAGAIYLAINFNTIAPNCAMQKGNTMKSFEELIFIWQSHALNMKGQAHLVLREHEFTQSSLDREDIGGAYVKKHGRFFDFDASGQFMILQGIWEYNDENPEEPILCDMIAWHPSQPKEILFLRGEEGGLLGEKSLFMAQTFQDDLSIYETPFDWLKNDSNGCVLLDVKSIHELIGVSRVICTNSYFGKFLKTQLTQYIYRGFPEFYVSAQGGLA